MLKPKPIINFAMTHYITSSSNSLISVLYNVIEEKISALSRLLTYFSAYTSTFPYSVTLWLKLAYDSTAIRPYYDHSTIGLPVRGVHRGLNKSTPLGTGTG